MAPTPTLCEQGDFWDAWNERLRTSGLDSFMERQLLEALRLVHMSGAAPLRILDVGCGTGWLSGSLTPYGRVTGIDLSPRAIEAARANWPQADFIAGDFESLHPDAEFDLVVSADVIAHVANQKDFIDKIATITRPGGTLLLMTQNRTVWQRTRGLSPQHPAQLRSWPRLRHLRKWLAPSFTIERIASIVPGGDQGLLRVVNSHYLVDAARALHREDAWVGARERARIGRELVITASRR